MKVLGNIFLIDTKFGSVEVMDTLAITIHLLGCLVSPETESSACALHNYSWTKSAQHACLVIFRWIQICNNNIILVCKCHVACWAYWSLTVLILWSRELTTLSAIETEDMTIDVCIRSRSYNDWSHHLQVVTTASSVSPLRHFVELQRRM